MYSLGKCHICSREGKFCVSVYPAINLELLTVRNQDRPATLLSAGHQVNKSQLESFNCIFNRTANFATFFQHFPLKHYFSWILKFASLLFGGAVSSCLRFFPSHRHSNSHSSISACAHSKLSGGGRYNQELHFDYLICGVLKHWSAPNTKSIDPPPWE